MFWAICWQHWTIRRKHTSRRKQKSYNIMKTGTWFYISLGYLVIVYINQSYSLSARTLDPQTGSFMLTLQGNVGFLNSEFSQQNAEGVNSIRELTSTKCVDPSLAEKDHAARYRHSWISVFCCSECDAQSFRTCRLLDIPKSSLTWIAWIHSQNWTCQTSHPAGAISWK